MTDMTNAEKSKLYSDAAEILRNAADKLRNGQWAQGVYFLYSRLKDGDCPMCAHGAVAYVGNPEVRERLAAVAPASTADAVDPAAAAAVWAELSLAESRGSLYLAHHIAAKHGGVTFEFNDAPGRTKEEVVAGLERGAQYAEDYAASMLPPKPKRTERWGTKRFWAQTFRKAAKLIETHGWVRGSMTGGEGSHCMVGAIAESCHKDYIGDNPSRAWHLFTDMTPIDGLPQLTDAAGMALCAAIGHNCERPSSACGSRVTGWNDTVAGSAKEVTSALRKAASMLEHGGKVRSPKKGAACPQ